MAAQSVLVRDVKLAQWNEINSSERDSVLECGPEPSGPLSHSGSAQSARGLAQSRARRADGSATNGRAFILLDVRRADERAKGFISDSIHIPLDQVRARMNEMPRDREIVVHCESGQRSYFACRILAQHGFRVRNLTGSYRTWKTASASIDA